MTMMDDPIKVEAQLRHQAHENHPTHRPLSTGYELVGLRGEERLADVFGGSVDMTRRPGGDNGFDQVVWLVAPYKVDVKTARNAFNLIVEVGKVDPRTIYVLAEYDDEFDTAQLVGWEWGSVLLRAPTKDFGCGVLDHYIPRARLREIGELLDR